MQDVQRGTPEARRKKLFVLRDELGLTDEERIEFTQYLLRRDITSWTQLDDAQVDRLLDALEGAKLVLALFSLRR